MTRAKGAKFTSVEICAGAGGQAVGLHQAGFQHRALIEIDKDACETLRENVRNNPEWAGCRVIEADLKEFKAAELRLPPGELDLLAGGVPCPPFSFAGKQLGADDERDLFPVMLQMAADLRPKAVMIENVRGLLEPEHKFASYRDHIKGVLEELGYKVCYWRVLEACDYGVPQLRPRAILVAMRPQFAEHFRWTEPKAGLVTVASALEDSMYERFAALGKLDPVKYADWEERFKRWHQTASGGGVAPTLVGGSKKHGGADLGPTRAKKAWQKLGICGLGVANEAHAMTDPERDLCSERGPKLTVTQAAIIQGFPASWIFTGRKTAAYRQVGNAFPPPVARAVGEQIRAALTAGRKAVAQNSTEPRDGAEAVAPGTLFPLSAPSVPLPAEPVHRSGDLKRAVAG